MWIVIIYIPIYIMLPNKSVLSRFDRNCPTSDEGVRNQTELFKSWMGTSEIDRNYPKSDRDIWTRSGDWCPKSDGTTKIRRRRARKDAVIGTLYTLQSILTTQGTHTIWSPSSRSLFEGRSEVLLSKSEIFFLGSSTESLYGAKP